MAEIDSLRTWAIDEVGYLEKSWAAYNEDPTVIYDKTRGAGRDNVTKYAKEMDDLQVYNTPKQGYSWCKVFVDWCFVKAFGLDRASELLIGWTAGCTQAYNWFKANGKTVSNPQKGDLVFFGDCEHIGIVMDVDDAKIYTVEGNTSGTTGLVANGGSVAQKEYSRSSRYIYGYARPAYNEEPQPQPPTPPQPSEYTFEDFVTDVQIAEGQTGKDVDGIAGSKTLRLTPTVSETYNRHHAIVTPLERWLKELGYYDGDIEEDLGQTPTFGAGMREAVKGYQYDNYEKIRVIDGEITAKCNTWKCLLQLI